MSSRISRWNLSSLAMAASRASSRRAICSRGTRSVVRVNSTRQPFSTRAKPRAAARWLLPPPGGPNNSKLAPLFRRRPGREHRRDPRCAWEPVHRNIPDLVRIVVAIDPAVSTGEDADETGIIVAGKDADGQGYVLADQSARYAPTEWARTAIALYRQHKADRIVAEVNNGGDMVEATIRMVDPNVSYNNVHASRGKVIRAEPVAALYEQRRIHHVGAFPTLEDQQCAFAPDFDRASAGFSPDRVDAFTDLLVEPMSNEGFYFWAKEKAA